MPIVASAENLPITAEPERILKEEVHFTDSEVKTSPDDYHTACRTITKQQVLIE